MTAKQFLTALIVLTSLTYLNGSAWAMDSFEGSSPPSNWTVSGGGSISIASSVHYKDGSKALKWDWNNGSYLCANSPANLSTAGTADAGFIIFWVHNETAVDEHLTFYFGDQTEILAGTCRYKFEFGLNFTGWRAGWVRFSEDAVNPSWTGDTSMDWMFIESPASGSGTLYLDMVDFLVDEISWKRSRDYQLPFINPEHQDLLAVWQQAYKWSQESPEDPPPGSVTQDQKDDFNIIKQRYEDFLLGSGRTSSDITEDFDTAANQTIDDSGSTNEVTRVAGNTGYRWGAYTAGSTVIRLDDSSASADKLMFRKTANTHGSYAYTIFDSNGNQPPTSPSTVNLGTISWTGNDDGLIGTYVRYMVRKAADSTWYLSDPVAAASSVSTDVEDVQWIALTSASNINLNALANGDEAAISTTGSSGSFSSKVGGIIDGGGFYIETGTENYFGIPSVTWGKGLDFVSIRTSSLQSFISNGVSK